MNKFIENKLHVTKSSDKKAPIDYGFIDDMEEGIYNALLIKNSTTLKQRFEASVNLVTRITDGLSRNFTQGDSHLSADGIGRDHLDAIIKIGMFLGYFMNCTSWDTQEMKSYDVQELHKRLDDIKRMIRVKEAEVNE
jgi:hypothetical protein